MKVCYCVVTKCEEVQAVLVILQGTGSYWDIFFEEYGLVFTGRMSNLDDKATA